MCSLQGSDKLAKVPYSLNNYAECRLEKLGQENLRALCKERNIAIPLGSTLQSLRDSLLQWKKKYKENKVSHMLHVKAPVDDCAGESEDDIRRARSIPWELNYYANHRLSALSVGTLRQLCKERKLTVADNSSTDSMVSCLMEWKGKPFVARLKKNSAVPNDSMSDKNAARRNITASDTLASAASATGRTVAPKPFPPERNQPLVIVTHNVRQFSKRSIFCGENSLQMRIRQLVRCYGYESSDMPAVLAIQECMAGSEPLEELSAALSARWRGYNYAYQASAPVGGGRESMGFVYDTKKVTLLDMAVGIPIAPGHRLVSKNLAQPLPASFADKVGFDEVELRTHKYLNADEITKLFTRQPAYALFEVKSSKTKILLCSVHLAVDPTQELTYTGELVHHNPEQLYADKRIIMILCGDLNLTACKWGRQWQELPATLSQNEGKWTWGLQPPFNNHTTNLSAYLDSSSTTGPQCYDNFLLPSFVCNHSQTFTCVMSLPCGFNDFLMEQWAKQREAMPSEQEGAIAQRTRGRSNRAFYFASQLFSDHLPVKLRLWS